MIYRVLLINIILESNNRTVHYEMFFTESYGEYEKDWGNSFYVNNIKRFFIWL